MKIYSERICEFIKHAGNADSIDRSAQGLPKMGSPVQPARPKEVLRALKEIHRRECGDASSAIENANGKWCIHAGFLIARPPIDLAGNAVRNAMDARNG
jgi:hypothetical protein